MKKLLLFALLFAGAALPLGAGPLKIGWASAPIHDGRTHTQIYGQSHLRWDRDGVLDPLTATCLVIDDGKDQLIFLSVDITDFGYANPFEPHLMKLLSEIAPDVPQEKILSGATHTHTSGDMEYRPIVKHWQEKIGKTNEFTPYAANAVAQVIKRAWESRKPGRVAYGFSYAVVGHQRRAVYFDDQSKLPGAHPLAMLINGHAAMYGRTDKPDFSHHETGADPAVNFLFTFDETGEKLTGAIVNIPCPSQCSETEWALSADYWNDVRENLRSRYGKDLYVLPQCAAAGDLSPHLRSYERASRRKWRLKYGRKEKYREEFNRRDIAERVGIAFADAYGWAQKEKFADLPVQNRRIRLALPWVKPTEGDVEAARRVLEMLKDVDKEKTDGLDDKARRQIEVKKAALFRARTVISRHETYSPKNTFDTYVNVGRLGDIAFFSNPFELYMDYMHRLQARSPFEQTFVIQLGMPGKGTYLGTARAQANRGYGVGATTKVSTEGGQMMIEKVLETLKEMHDGALPPEAKK